MLGTLARWLRLSGYDTVYYNDCEDNILLMEAKLDGRVLLTRDKELERRANRKNVKAFLVESSEYKKQLILVKSAYGLTLRPKSSRCSSCNGILRRIGKAHAKSIVPEKTYNTYDEFWVCESCCKAYWKGGHWDKIMQTFQKINE
jgi:uncharacterized protein with PIN domain